MRWERAWVAKMFEPRIKRKKSTTPVREAVFFSALARSWRSSSMLVRMA